MGSCDQDGYKDTAGLYKDKKNNKDQEYERLKVLDESKPFTGFD